MDKQLIELYLESGCSEWSACVCIHLCYGSKKK